MSIRPMGSKFDPQLGIHWQIAVLVAEMRDTLNKSVPHCNRLSLRAGVIRMPLATDFTVQQGTIQNCFGGEG